MTIDPSKIAVRDPVLSDVPLILDYWFRSPPGFMASMGVDWAKMPSEAEMEARLNDRIREDQKLASSKLAQLIITYEQRPIGVHVVNPLAESIIKDGTLANIYELTRAEAEKLASAPYRLFTENST